MADETAVYPQAKGQSASCALPRSLPYVVSHPLTHYLVPGSPEERCPGLLPATGQPRFPLSLPDLPGGVPTDTLLHPTEAGSELWSEGASWGGGCGAEGGTEPLPSLVTFEKDRIRRKVNVTLLFSWGPERREADPGF